MKCKLLCGLLGVMLTRAAMGTDAVYENNGSVIAPPDIAPQVDAVSFINTGYFSVDLPTSKQYTTANTLNYTNTGMMTGYNGFDLQTFPDVGVQRMAANYFNSGTMDCGLKLLVSATNINNPGNVAMGYESLLKFTGQNVDLSRSVLAMQGVSSFLNNTFGVFGADYGTGLCPVPRNQAWNPRLDLNPTDATSPIFTNHLGYAELLYLGNSLPYVIALQNGNPTNVVVRAIFLQNNNPAVSTKVYFDPNQSVGFGGAHIEWAGAHVDPQTGVMSTNFFYLSGVMDRTTNAFINNGIPDTFSFAQTNGSPLTFSFPPMVSGMPPNLFNSGTVTNSYAYVDATVVSTTVSTNDIVGNSVTNLPGRIHIAARSNLDLTLAQISGPNYLLLDCTNQFNGNVGSQIGAPYADIKLGVTNGFLAVSNLWQPALPYWSGSIQAWNTRWFAAIGGTNFDFRVLLVNSTLIPTAPAYVQDLIFHATNSLVISDTFNVYRTLSIDAENLTLTTNGYGNGAISPDGELNLSATIQQWATVVPRLQRLTNNGAIRMQGLNQNFGSSGNRYLSFINTGVISDFGSTIWADNFQNSGTFSNLGGAFILHSLDTTLINGIITATNDITITTASLNTSNTVLQAGGGLSLTATNLLTDNGVTNGNIWTVGSGTVLSVVNGLSLPLRPAVCDLLGTTITNTIPGPNKQNINVWSGQNRGASPAGFTNNAAVGRLILDAHGASSQFLFNPRAGETNALYVDYLELRNYATNRNLAGDFYTSLSISSNFIIYYAQAIVNGVSYAEKLNHKNGDRLRWISSYAGHFSSTNLVYGGTTNTVNAALAQSTTEDTDGDGIVNAADPTPFFLAGQLNFSLTVTNYPPLTTVLHWDTIPNATNYVFYRTNLITHPWQNLTNFVSPLPYPSAPATMTVTDPVDPASPRYYKVQVDPQLP